MSKKRLSKLVLIASGVSVIVIAAVVIGILLLDSPAQARLRRMDERRVSDLRVLSIAVDAYWTREGRLPVSLDELSVEERIVGELIDPETAQPYEYRVIDDGTYELCATFALDTESDDRDYLYRSIWFHGPGRECFQREAVNVNQNPEIR